MADWDDETQKVLSGWYEELTKEEVYTDMKKCLQLQGELQDIHAEVEELFSRWEVLESL